MNKDWHSSHFCCWQCDESLTGNRYVLRDDHPYCIKCYESVFANQCEECNKTIGIDSKVRQATMIILFNAKCKIYYPRICIKITL
jgi:LIM domain